VGFFYAILHSVVIFMQMHQRLFIYKHSPVSYYRYGNGPEFMVAFHGYGQSGVDFAYFEEALGNKLTIIAIDFFWHGQSKWLEAQDFSELDMRSIVIGIAKQERIFARKFMICSFSMGARMARALVRTFPERITRVIFISPPTANFSRFLNFTVGTRLGLALFNYFLDHNQSLLWWVDSLYKCKILNRSVKIFTSKFIARQDRLRNVYQTWFAQRKLRTNFRTFARIVDAHGIEVVLIAGKNDHITPPKQNIRYVKKLKKRRVFITNQKHQLQSPQVLHILKKLFIHKIQ
jgi:pimeloyl-ACP methyl ester carboxylesterase